LTDRRQKPRDAGGRGLTVRLVRAFGRSTQRGLAKVAGVSPATIARAERGEALPRRSTLARLASGVGLDLAALERLLPLLRSAKAGGAPPPTDFLDSVSLSLHLATGELAFDPAAFTAPRVGAPLDFLLALPAEERRVWIERVAECRSWQISVHASDASAAAAAHDAVLALELAELALFIAERVSGSELWRARVQGRAWGFVGNARRVGNDLLQADRAFETAWALWKAGVGADHGILDASRLPDLQASLRRDQRRWGEALALLDQALAASPNGERSACILLKKGSTYVQQGDYAAALGAMEQAAPLADPVRDPRLVFGLRYNVAVALCHLGRYSEAAPRLAEARELAFKLRNDLDLVRIVWLDAKVSAGLGRRDEAIAALRQVQVDFVAHELPADAALAALELAVLLLEEPRTREVRELAVEMLPIFASLRFGEEALAALRLFWEAALQEQATAEIGRRLLAYLERARYHPDLRFESPSGLGDRRGAVG
jgi:tetratricopeptide (TPR) repeat protein